MQLPISETGSTDTPTLDVTVIPHAVRHGAIHGALSTRDVGQALILVAPHDPLPLLREVAEREDSFDVTYLNRGPEQFRLKFTRIA